MTTIQTWASFVPWLLHTPNKEHVTWDDPLMIYLFKRLPLLGVSSCKLCPDEALLTGFPNVGDTFLMPRGVLAGVPPSVVPGVVPVCGVPGASTTYQQNKPTFALEWRNTMKKQWRNRVSWAVLRRLIFVRSSIKLHLETFNRFFKSVVLKLSTWFTPPSTLALHANSRFKTTCNQLIALKLQRIYHELIPILKQGRHFWGDKGGKRRGERERESGR